MMTVSSEIITALQATGNAGRVITMGFSTRPDEVNQFVITSKELDVRGSRLQLRDFKQYYIDAFMLSIRDASAGSHCTLSSVSFVSHRASSASFSTSRPATTSAQKQSILR